MGIYFQVKVNTYNKIHQVDIITFNYSHLTREVGEVRWHEWLITSRSLMTWKVRSLKRLNQLRNMQVIIWYHWRKINHLWPQEILLVGDCYHNQLIMPWYMVITWTNWIRRNHLSHLLERDVHLTDPFKSTIVSRDLHLWLIKLMKLMKKMMMNLPNIRKRNIILDN